jgi:hypothetical protein
MGVLHHLEDNKNGVAHNGIRSAEILAGPAAAEKAGKSRGRAHFAPADPP